jgi:hypothetical protein
LPILNAEILLAVSGTTPMMSIAIHLRSFRWTSIHHSTPCT